MFRILQCAAAVAMLSVVTTHEAAASACDFKDWRSKSGVSWRTAELRPVKAPFNIPWAQAEAKTLFWFDRAKGQNGRWWGGVDKGGKLSIETQAINGARIDGDHFMIVVSLRDQDGRVIRNPKGQPVSHVHKIGLDAKGTCQARRGGRACYRSTKAHEDRIGPRGMQRAAFVRVDYGIADKVDDKIFWEDVRAVVDCVSDNSE